MEPYPSVTGIYFSNVVYVLTSAKTQANINSCRRVSKIEVLSLFTLSCYSKPVSLYLFCGMFLNILKNVDNKIVLVTTDIVRTFSKLYFIFHRRKKVNVLEWHMDKWWQMFLFFLTFFLSFSLMLKCGVFFELWKWPKWKLKRRGFSGLSERSACN